MASGSGTVKAAILAALSVYACQWLGALSDQLYFGLLPTTLAAAGCFWCYRLIIKSESKTEAS